MHPAHAKLNLALAVAAPEPAGSPRAGWHRIASWFVPLALHDELELVPLPAGSPSTHTIRWAADAPRPSPIDWPIEADLAVRAHRLLEAHVARALPVALTVTKRTPVGGGLGGGSSDAAAAIAALNSRLDLGLSAGELARLSAKLGSDVGYFLDPARAGQLPPRPAFVSGFGDTIDRSAAVARPIDAPIQVTLILPPFGCPTPAVYKAFDGLPPGPFREDEARRLAGNSPLSADGELFNDLEPAARAVEPRLGPLIDALRAAVPQRRVHMTGSGSTLFSLGAPHPALARAAGEHGAAVVNTVIPATPAVP